MTDPLDDEVNGLLSPLMGEEYDQVAGGLSIQEQQVIDEILKKNEEHSFLHGFEIEYIVFPDVIDKAQRRFKVSEKQISQQRLNKAKSKIKLKLKFNRREIFHDIYCIIVKVQRQLAHKNLPSEEATLNEATTQIYQLELFSNEVYLEADLDSVYETGDKKAFELLRSANSEHNKFVAVIEAYFLDGSNWRDITKPFLCIGSKENDNEFILPDMLNGSKKKRRLDSEHSSSPQSIQSDHNSSTIRSRCGSAASRSGRLNKQYIKVQEMVCKVIRSNLGKFDTIEGKVIKTGNGDIAYHFIIKNPEEHIKFKHGMVVGFFTDELGKTVILLLTSTNISDAFLKGVVSDSYYLEGNKPSDETVKTVIICMFGLVPVDIIGSVEAGDNVYASTKYPGTAHSEFHATHREDQQQTALLGQAMENHKTADEEQVHQVKALVSLCNTANFKVMHSQMNEMEDSLNIQLKKGRKYSKRCYILTTLTICVCFVMLLALFYQYFVPGSSLRRALCEAGAKDGGKSYAKTWNWQDDKGQSGVEFECTKLWEKVKHRFHTHRHPQDHSYKYQCPEPSYHYYLNIDTCSGVGTAPIMFAVNPNCTHAYLFNEHKGRWDVEELVCWKPKCNIVCSLKPRKRKGICYDKYYKEDCEVFNSTFNVYFQTG